MEFEYFLAEKDWQELFEYWRKEMREWFASLGFAEEDIKEVEIGDGDRAHYSKRTIDFHFRYPHKFDEIGGLAYRTDFDLKNHIEHSGVDLSYLDPTTNKNSYLTCLSRRLVLADIFSLSSRKHTRKMN